MPTVETFALFGPRIAYIVSANATTIEERSHWLNPVILKWAREWRGRSLDEVAVKTKKDVRLIEDWERGERTPTVKQARMLADFYDRPFLEFLLPQPPQLPEPVSLPDYRMHRDTQPPSQNWDLQDIQQWAETQRINALDLYSEIGEPPPELPKALFATPGETSADVAERSREILSFPIERQMEMTQAEARDLPGILRDVFERVGVLTLKRTELAELKVRGICIAEFPLPVIVVTRESPSAQAFTLVHEFAHVLLKQSGVSGSIDRNVRSTDVEGWCNRYTGAFLMPERYVQELMGARPARPADRIEDIRLASFAKAFRVSAHAMLIRLVHLGYVAPDYYWNIKKPEFDRQEADYSGGGRSTYYGSRYRGTQGDLYTGLVLEAWSNGRITNHNAAEFMGIKKLEHLEAIRDRFGAS